MFEVKNAGSPEVFVNGVTQGVLTYYESSDMSDSCMTIMAADPQDMMQGDGMPGAGKICHGPNSADWTCTVCGTMTFGSKKTDQCFHCKTVRKRSGK